MVNSLIKVLHHQMVRCRNLAAQILQLDDKYSTKHQTDDYKISGFCIYTYALLSLVFIIVNIITLSNLPPWIDEVMFLDTSYNAALHGSWETTAWYRVVGQFPFSTYPPLYQMLATAWMWMVGCSIVTVRSLNLLFMFILGSLCLHIMKRHKIRLTPQTVVLFTLLFWGCYEITWMYRNGRPDILCALVFACTILLIDSYLSNKSRANRITVIIATAFLLCSGIQAAMYLCACWLFFYIMKKEHRKDCVHLLFLLITGFLIGFSMVLLFMFANGRMVAFLCSIIQYSSTLSSLAIFVLPYIGKTFGFSPTLYILKLQGLTTNSGFLEQLTNLAEYYGFIVLLFAALIVYFFYFRNNPQRLLNDNGFLLVLFTLYVPLFMNIAGRFASYYLWMVFLPLIIAITLISTRIKLGYIVFISLTVATTVISIKSMMSKENWNYKNICSFVERQHFKPTDSVICPFALFYEMKPVCDTCYFIGIFPQEYLGHIDYIVEMPDGDKYDHLIIEYVNKLKTDTATVLTIIDHIDCPSLTLYQVKTKHE